MKIAAIYLALFFSVLLFAFARGRQRDVTPTDPMARRAPVAMSAEPERDPGWIGVVLASRTVDIGTKSGGLVRTTAALPGDVVRVGQLLASLDARDKAQALVVARAEARAEADRAARREKMFAASLASKEEAETAKFAALAKSARAEEARLVLDGAEIRAPFDGSIVARFVEPGGHVAPGQPLFRLVGTGPSKLRFGVPSELADDLSIGAQVRFTSKEAVSAQARIVSISSEVDPSAGLVVIDAEVAAEAQSFRSGTEVRVFPRELRGAVANSRNLP